jgi:UTP:GlnB (protein PII) uridylyltransferase
MTNDRALTAALRRVMPEMYFVNTPITRMRRHYELLTQLGSAGSTLELQPQIGAPLSEMNFAAYDDSEPGLLAKLCGTLSALQLSIHTAFIYTFRDEESTFGLDPQRWVALDTFLISENYRGFDRTPTAPTEKKLRQELARVLLNETTVAQLLSKARRRPFAPLNIYEIAMENRDASLTRLTLHAEDNPGVLYRSTAALAHLNLHIRVAQISTRDEAADDIFFITDAQGTQLPDAQLSSIAVNLRTLLQDAAAPFGLTGEI